MWNCWDTFCASCLYPTCLPMAFFWRAAWQDLFCPQPPQNTAYRSLVNRPDFTLANFPFG